MRPGTNQQIWLLARRTQGLIILELPVQEDIVPATHQIHRRVHLCNAMAEIDRFPVVVLRPVQQSVLVMLGWLVNHNLVGFARWQVSKSSLQSTSLPELRELRPEG